MVVEFKIDKGIEIFDDAIASVKTEGLIGDKFVAIDPGGGGDLLADGDTITDTNSPTRYHGSDQQVCLWRCGRRGRK